MMRAIAAIMGNGAPFLRTPIPYPVLMAGDDYNGWSASINLASYVVAPGRTPITYRRAYAASGPLMGDPSLDGSVVSGSSSAGSDDKSGLESFASIEVTANGLSISVAVTFRVP